MVVDFDGSDGTIIVDRTWLETGSRKSRTGKRLYITSDALVAGVDGVAKPTVDYIYRE